MSTPYDPHLVIEIGSRTIDSWAEDSRVEGAEVELVTGATSQAEFRLFDPDPDFPFISSLTKASEVTSSTVRVWLGFGPRAELGEPIFKGLLARVEYHMGVTAVCAFDMGFRMKKVQKTEYHYKLTDLQLIEKLARRNGLGFEGPDAPVSLDKIPSYKQEARTDWDEALAAAERCALGIYVRDDTLFAKEAAKTAPTPLHIFNYRRDFMLLDDFHLRYRVPENQEGRPAIIKTRTRGRGGKRLEGQSEEHERGTQQVALKRDLHVKSKKHADKRAEARKLLKREHTFEGSISVLPSYRGERTRPRSTIALGGLPGFFSGKWLVERVTHILEPGELTAEMDVYREK